MFTGNVYWQCLQVAQGLLWVWPDAGSAAQAGVTPPPLTEQWGSKDWTLLVSWRCKVPVRVRGVESC
jgi:phenylpropionate dioxygenase-like ring-hydroxylating dioxygenase large terminal subunit